MIKMCSCVVSRTTRPGFMGGTTGDGTCVRLLGRSAVATLLGVAVAASAAAVAVACTCSACSASTCRCSCCDAPSLILRPGPSLLVFVHEQVHDAQVVHCLAVVEGLLGIILHAENTRKEHQNHTF
jgi:hypothetical protein